MEKRGASTLTSGLDVVHRVPTALEAAGVEFLNRGQPVVRLAKLGRRHSVSIVDAVSIEQQKANADDVRAEAAIAVDRVLADTDATKDKKVKRRAALTAEPAVIAAARGRGQGRKR